MIAFFEGSPEVAIQSLKEFSGMVISQYHDSFEKVLESGKIIWNIGALFLQFTGNRPEAFVYFLAEFCAPVFCCYFGAPCFQESEINRLLAFPPLLQTFLLVSIRKTV